MARPICKLRAALAAAVTLNPNAFLTAQVGDSAASLTERSYNYAADTDQSGWLFLPYAQFKIPFNVEPGGSPPAQVQLFVSADNGASWQSHSKLASDKRYFEFRAASEGAYLFGVQTKDASGNSFNSTTPPMRVIVDTTKPQTSVQVDLDSANRLIAILEVQEQYLDAQTVLVQYRIDQEANWSDVNIAEFNRQGDTYRGHAVISPGRCREVWVRLSCSDLAQNKSEASCNYKMPRTASVPTGLMVSQRDTAGRTDQSRNNAAANGSTPGAVLWSPNSVPSLALKPGTSIAAQKTADSNSPQRTRQDLSAWAEMRRPSAANSTNVPPTTINSMVSIGSSNSEELVPDITVDELPAPNSKKLPNGVTAADMGNTERLGADKAYDVAKQKAADSPPHNNEEVIGDSLDRPATPFSRAYHSRSQAFSLDYAVESLKGSQVAEIELWGTEDGGRSWVEWGKDPDRESPFDIQVADDGLFGFRMVVVGKNGLVSNRPKNGDDADMWINVDSIAPIVRITRAVYGEGEKTGMLVIDYKCDDNNLHEQPITLSYSDHQDGPWTTIAGGLRNAGVYLWKVGPNLPEKIYLRIEAIDRAGNVGTNRLDIPIAVEGLVPRGRIQGFRPLENK